MILSVVGSPASLGLGRITLGLGQLKIATWPDVQNSKPRLTAKIHKTFRSCYTPI